MDPAQLDTRLNIFISYSRDDIQFVDQLDAALQLHGYNVSIDRHGISGGEAWKTRLVSLIRDADTIIFILSPASASSESCAWEVNEAVRLGKRLIPVLPIPSPNNGRSWPPPMLRRLFFWAYLIKTFSRIRRRLTALGVVVEPEKIMTR